MFGEIIGQRHAQSSVKRRTLDDIERRILLIKNAQNKTHFHELLFEIGLIILDQFMKMQE